MFLPLLESRLAMLMLHREEAKQGKSLQRVVQPIDETTDELLRTCPDLTLHMLANRPQALYRIEVRGASTDVAINAGAAAMFRLSERPMAQFLPIIHSIQYSTLKQPGLAAASWLLNKKTLHWFREATPFSIAHALESRSLQISLCTFGLTAILKASSPLDRAFIACQELGLLAVAV